MTRIDKRLFLLGALSGLLWIAIWRAPFDGDATQYVAIARSLAAGGGFALDGAATMVREPGYPAFMAAALRLSGDSLLAVRLAQALLLGVLAVAAHRVARRFLDEGWAISAAAASALVPQMAVYASLLLSELPTAVALAAAVLLAMRADGRDRLRDSAFAGAALGALALFKAATLPFLPFAAALMWLRKRSFRHGAVFLAAGLLLVTPWALRNRAEFGKTAIASRGGLVAYVRASRTEFPPEDRALLLPSAMFGDRLVSKVRPDIVGKWVALDGSRAMWDRMASLRAQGWSDDRIEAEFAREAVATIEARPFAYLFDGLQQFFLLNMIAVPVVDMRALFAGTHAGTPDLVKDAIVVGLRLLNFALIALVAFGLWTARKTAGAFWPAVFIVYWNLIYMAIDAIPRYAVPIMPLYAIFAAVALNRLKTPAVALLLRAGSRIRRGPSS